MHDRNIPLWVLIWVFLMAVLPLGFVIVAYVDPGYFGEEWANLGNGRFANVFGYYTSQNFATGVVTLIALAWRMPRPLMLVLLLRILAELAVIWHKTLSGISNFGFVTPAVILIVVSTGAIIVLWRNERKPDLPNVKEHSPMPPKV